jgi:AcrR family transcriptional regulator
MSRPRSEDKRQAILAAATQLFAEAGLNAPTARIARTAGVAEGTLFTYFPSKDDLLNQLYLELKGELRGMMLPAYPAQAGAREQIHHAWRIYVQWGSTHPGKRRVLAQLGLCERLSEAARAAGAEAFCDLNALLGESVRQGLLRDQPTAFVAAIMGALAETTMDFIARDPAQAEHTSEAGFAAFWNAISRT